MSKQLEISNQEVEALVSASGVIKTNAEVYLREARRAAHSNRACEFEAIAIKRALIADTLDQIVADSPQSSDLEFEAETSLKEDISITQADEKSLKACDRLYSRTEDSRLKKLLRDIRLSIVGFGMGKRIYS